MAIREPLGDRDGSWSELISGIVNDATSLFAKEIELAKLELRSDLRNAKALLIGVAAGAFIVVLGAALLGIAMALALATYTTLPQWACFAIVGALMVLAGGGFMMLASRNRRKFDFIPQRTAEAVKEDIGWINSTIKTSSAIARTGTGPARS